MKNAVVDYSSAVECFVEQYQLITCKRDKLYYMYDEMEGVYKSIDETEMKKLIDAFILSGINEGIEWSEYSFRVFLNHIDTKAPYVEKMGNKAGTVVMQNGTFNLKKQCLQKHSRSNLAIARLSFNYDETADCPAFDAYVKSVANGDKNLELTLYEVAGYVLAGCTKAEKLILCLGSGANGKSIFLEILRELAGRNFTSALSIQEINGEKAFDRIELLNSRLNIIHELGKKETLESVFDANVKKIVTGEDISAERKFREKVFFKPKMVIVAASNYLPEMSAAPSESLLRRYLVLNFTKAFTGKEKDVNLLKKIMCEMPGVFNRVLDGYMRLKQNHFVFSYQEKSDLFLKQQVMEKYPMFVFVQENVVMKAGNRLFYDELRKKYLVWSKTVDITTFDEANANSLSKRLLTTIQACHFPIVQGKSNGNRFLEGIALKNDNEY